MMYQKKSNRWMMLKALFILPVTCFAIYAFATPEADAQVQQVKKTAVTQQKKATPAPQKKDVTVNIKMGDKTGQGTLSKEKAEQLKKDTEAKFGNKVKVTLSESTPKDRTVQNIKKEDIKGTAYESVDQALQAQSAIIDCPEELAQFPGGDEACYKWLADHVKYPEEAKKNGIQGRVHVHFVVEKNGEITDVKVLRSPNPLLAEEAERVVKSMPLWKPAKNKGEIVRSSFNLPLSFRLSSPEPSKE